MAKRESRENFINRTNNDLASYGLTFFELKIADNKYAIQQYMTSRGRESVGIDFQGEPVRQLHAELTDWGKDPSCKGRWWVRFMTPCPHCGQGVSVLRAGLSLPQYKREMEMAGEWDVHSPCSSCEVER